MEEPNWSSSPRRIGQDGRAHTADRRRQGRPCVTWADMRSLGEAIGRPDRAVVAIVDAQMAEAVRKALHVGNRERLG